MEANLCKQLFSAAEEGGSAQMSNLGKHGLPESICAFAFTGVSEDLKTGYLYQIDHKHLPPKSPNQLKAIRVVMLAEKNEMHVSVRFPSSYALRSYFTLPKKVNTVQPTRKYPDLDEQFVMDLKLAKVVLIRQIFPPELQQQGRLQSFWLMPQNVTEVSTSTVDDNSNDGLCGSTLNTGGFLTWGVRRRITFVKKKMEENTTIQRVSSFSSLVKEEDGAADLDVDSVDDETTIVTRKRKRRSCRNKKTPSKAFTYEKKKPGNRIANRQKPKLSYGRWSRERYENAEVKMLEIMKEKGAVYERPVLRPALRSEARKHIGDTGLLDHLLKHMSRKVAPNGIVDRFRRRHNSDGHMEYWLESADLDDTNTIVMVVYLRLLNKFLLASDSRGSRRVKRELIILSEINRKFKVYGPFCIFASGKRKFNRIVHRELAEKFSALPTFPQFRSFIKLVTEAVRIAKKECPLEKDKTCSYIISSAEIKDGKFLVQGSVKISTSDLSTSDIRPISAIGCGTSYLPDSFFSEEDWEQCEGDDEAIKRFIDMITDVLELKDSCGGAIEFFSLGINDSGELEEENMLETLESLVKIYDLRKKSLKLEYLPNFVDKLVTVRKAYGENGIADRTLLKEELDMKHFCSIGRNSENSQRKKRRRKEQGTD